MLLQTDAINLTALILCRDKIILLVLGCVHTVKQFVVKECFCKLSYDACKCYGFAVMYGLAC